MSSKWLFCLALFVTALPLAAQTGKVVIYQPKRPMAFLSPLGVWIDDKKAIMLEAGRYAIAELPPGGHEFRAAAKGYVVTLEIEPGKTYYLRYDYVTGGWAGRKVLTPVDVTSGEAQSKRNKLAGFSSLAEPALFSEPHE
jgi:Protein of unknown function (DUF2846)